MLIKLKQAAKKLSRMIFSRAFLFGLVALFQFTILFLAVFSISELSLTFYFTLYALNIIFVIYLFRTDTNPSYKLTWVVVILAIPIFGGVLYFLAGVQRLDKKLLLRLERIKQKSWSYYEGTPDSSLQLKEIDYPLYRQAQYITRTTRMPVYSNTTSTYYANGESYFDALCEELRKAKHFIFLEYFIIREGVMWNRILDILKQKIKENVEVRLLYDDIGCLFTLPTGYEKKMNDLGIKTLVFNPLKLRMTVYINNRDHRKVCVIDGRAAFTGGINLADEYINEELRFGYWKDTGVLLKGEAVRSFTILFLEMWHFVSGQDIDDYHYYLPHDVGVETVSNELIQPYGDDPLDTINVSANTYINMINHSNEYLYITSPYLILDHEMITALSLAATSGVDVRIITPGIPDKLLVFYLTQSYYNILIQSGVKIYQYRPGFVHSKMFVSDDDVASVGTINLDYRSLYLHFECGCIFYHSPLIEDIKNDFLQMLDESELVTVEMIKATPLWKRLLQSFLRVIAPML